MLSVTPSKSISENVNQVFSNMDHINKTVSYYELLLSKIASLVTEVEPMDQDRVDLLSLLCHAIKNGQIDQAVEAVILAEAYKDAGQLLNVLAGQPKEEEPNPYDKSPEEGGEPMFTCHQCRKERPVSDIGNSEEGVLICLNCTDGDMEDSESWYDELNHDYNSEISRSLRRYE